ncbi:MAG: hypothetical protein ACREMD_16665 [Gemmatimonadota bacterium]
MRARNRRGRLGTRTRVILCVAGLTGWVVLVSTLHLGGFWTGGTSKGAAELLEIGALPVT